MTTRLRNVPRGLVLENDDTQSRVNSDYGEKVRSDRDAASADRKHHVTGSLWRLAPEHVDLLAKNQDLRFTPRAGQEQSNERTTKQSEQLDHRATASPDSHRFASYMEFPPVVPDRRYPEFDPLHDRGGIWVF
jgi:hypothetical protein